MRNKSLLTACLLVFLAGAIGHANARNSPCSGKKGGVSHCVGDTFVCNDGSVSGSKRSCSAEMGGGTSPRQLLTQPQRKNAASSDFSCRSGNVCTGPRSGRYCMTDAGSKSYHVR